MAASQLKSEKILKLRALLLAWYENNRRDLPWRRNHDPYSIWVSEIMLQQTRVAVVIERHQAFLKRFPTLLSLARAADEDVLSLWSGLGYYRRARMMHQTARLVEEKCKGNLPHSAAELRNLPGIGPYTAAAIASIAHSEPVAVVDGNVERVLCRFAGWDATSKCNETPLRRKIENLAAELLDASRPGDFNQALMELGALVCLPRNPLCVECPFTKACKTRGEHKTSPSPAMSRREIAYALSLRKGDKPGNISLQVLLEQRPSSLTVMPGMWELPTIAEPLPSSEDLVMKLRHAIMQVNYSVRIHSVAEDRVKALTTSDGKRRWVPLDEAGSIALTGLARKVLAKANFAPAPAKPSPSAK